MLKVVALAAFLYGGGACRTRPAPAQRVFVTNEDSGDVTVIDSANDEITRTLHVGKRPRGLRVSPDGRLLYVAVSGSIKSPPKTASTPPNDARLAAVGPVPGLGPLGDDDADAPRDGAADGIAVVDVERGAVTRMLPAGRDPEAFDVTADGTTLYVSNEETAEVSVVDIASSRIVRTVKVGREPEGVTISPDGRFVYVTSEAASEVDVLLARTGEVVARIPTGMRPRAVAFSPDGAQAYVTAELGGTLHVIDTTSRSMVGQVRTGKSGVKPMGIALAPDGTHAYVANGREGSVAVIDVATRRLERTVEGVGARAWGVAVTADGKKLYVAATPDIAVVDVASGTVTKRIRGGSGPWGVAVSRAPR